MAERGSPNGPIGPDHRLWNGAPVVLTIANIVPLIGPKAFTAAASNRNFEDLPVPD